jgi:PP-loop superfamily ATP-utilizing enzyme
MSRTCTADFKIGTLGRELKKRGATKQNPATVMVGISVDEIERAGKGANAAWEHRTYPLLDLGLTRSDCTKVIADAGLPVPPKSSCFFCPYHRPVTWAEMRRDEPDLFAKSVALETHMNDRNEQRGRQHVYLTRMLKPLTEAVQEAQQSLFMHDGPGENGCDTGHCWT